jgi:enoyl-CoA hydratase
MTDKILYTTQPNGIGILTFNRPSAKNALDLEAMQAFMAHIHHLQTDTSLRVLILTGAGDDAFCSGGDLVELSQHTSQDDARHFIGIMGDALLALERLPVPVIAAINGYALGGGSEIAVACDMRFVDDAVRLGFVQVKMALTPGWGAGQRLLRAVGYARAMELLLSGRILHAQEVYALGLANGISAKGEALQSALIFAETITQYDPTVLIGMKTLLRAGLMQPYEDALQIERNLFPPLWSADAHIQAVNAFLTRRG